MDEQHHPEPLQDAAQFGLQRALELATYAGAGAQVYLQHRKATAAAAAERDERARRVLNAQIRAEKDAARARWAPALDPRWLQTASFTETASAWGAAMPYADRAVPWYEPAAATALRKTEERLRELHPYAMARYDRLREQGLGPAEAMREAAPLFARPTHVRDAPYEPRPELTADADAGLRHAAQDQAFTAERRRAADLSASDQAATVGLDERTQGVVNARADAATAAGARARASRLARPWEHDFPMPIPDVIAHATGSRSLAATGSRAAAMGLLATRREEPRERRSP